uniref:Tubby C-terminal domain-containing protein n=1 Tax=Picea sitchensis TaxID=3332 RepID=A9NZY9_PICSI|nr:unknown [Picea sitchensis]
MHAKIHPHEPELSRRVVVDDKLSNSSVTALTVWRKSLVFSCNGFTVFDSSGNLVFRVDNYASDLKDEIVLMDAAGMALLTIRRKSWLSLQNQWKGFLGEFRDGKKPLFVVRRVTSLLIPTKTLAEVYMCSSAKRKGKPQFDYRVEGYYAKRSFTILNSLNKVVAEVKPKQVRSEITLGGDVFNLTVNPGYDQAFVMGLIVVLDQMMPS